MGNAGALNFTLGLQANQFVNALGISSGKLLSFAAIVNGVQTAFHKAWAAIEKGGALKDLAVRTNTSVASLYGLEKAFEQIGASADSAAPLILKLQRQLASEEGASALKALGLDPEQLKGNEAIDQINAIAGAMSKLNTSGQTAAAFKLFGREGANTMLQVARSAEEFRQSIAATRKDAETWQQVSGVFDTIGDTIKQWEGHMDTMAAKLTGAFVQAFREGQLIQTIGDVFGQVFSAVGDALPDLLMAGFVKLGEALLRVLIVPLTYLQDVLDASVQGWMGLVAKIPGVRNALGVSADFKPETFAEIHKRNQENGLDFFGANFGDMNQFASAKLKSGLETIAAGLKPVDALLDDFVSRLDKATKPVSDLVNNTALAVAAGKAGNAEAGTPRQTNFTSLEKMGFIFNGVNGRSDHGRDIAANTKQTVDLLKILAARRVSTVNPDDYANIV